MADEERNSQEDNSRVEENVLGVLPATASVEELRDQVIEELLLNNTSQNLGERAAIIVPPLRRLLILHRRQVSLARELQMEGMQDVVQDAEPQAFDPALPTRHTYLGDVDDLESSGTILEPSHGCCLPLLSLPGVVLSPGETLPLRLITRQQHHVAKMALTAPGIYSCLLVVACWNLLTQGHGLVACTAELRQMRELEDGTMNFLAIGRQRCRICKLRGGSRADVVILDDRAVQCVPREARKGASAWPSWVYKAFDPGVLAQTARTSYAEVAPQVQQPQCEPQALSFWLAANMSLHYRTRQELLAMDNTSYRLKRLLGLLHSMRNLHCRKCLSEIAHARHMLAMSEAGSGSVFVNAHGYTHELVTIKKVRGIVLVGHPQTEHSWFPGYAWTIAHCINCYLQLGWQFSAVERGLQPPAFWGLRSQAVKHGPSIADEEEDTSFDADEY